MLKNIEDDHSLSESTKNREIIWQQALYIAVFLTHVFSLMRIRKILHFIGRMNNCQNTKYKYQLTLKKLLLVQNAKK